MLGDQQTSDRSFRHCPIFGEELNLLPSGATHDIDATLHDLTVTEIRPDVALVTYRSEVRRPTHTEWANRASLWDNATGRWQLRFHQGTPCEAPT
ncbi:MAG: DUF4440 domain-containing protein [Tabrizicola sp.]